MKKLCKTKGIEKPLTVVDQILWKINTLIKNLMMIKFFWEPYLWWLVVSSLLQDEMLFVPSNFCFYEWAWKILHATMRCLWNHGLVFFMKMYCGCSNVCLWPQLVHYMNIVAWEKINCGKFEVIHENIVRGIWTTSLFVTINLN